MATPCAPTPVGLPAFPSGSGVDPFARDEYVFACSTEDGIRNTPTAGLGDFQDVIDRCQWRDMTVLHNECVGDGADHTLLPGPPSVLRSGVPHPFDRVADFDQGVSV